MPAHPYPLPQPAFLPITHANPDVVIAGAGIIGLSLALELDRRGAHVTVLESGSAMQQSSSAAAGMLAVHDPHNPPALLPLSQLSATLYPAFLQRIEALSGIAVRFQTDATVQYLEDGATTLLAEHSIDPRQLAHAMLSALRATRIHLREHAGIARSEAHAGRATAWTTQDERFDCTHLVYATGAWAPDAWASRTRSARVRATQSPALGAASGYSAESSLAESALPESRPFGPITPRKGQMLRVQLAPHLSLPEVHRSQVIYVVPRIHGPQAGTALIGATVEEAGFDTSTQAFALTHLRQLASQLLPALGDPSVTPAVEAWAGLRPGTPDALPLLGPLNRLSSLDSPEKSAELIATGHFRNGILLAPATASVLADLIESGRTNLDLSPFSATRFA